eukprot:2232701-Prymnesium_polylepis.1
MSVTLDTSQRLRSPVNAEQPWNFLCGRAWRGGQPARARLSWRRRGDAVRGRARGGERPRALGAAKGVGAGARGGR